MDNSEVNSLLTASFSYDEIEIDHAWAIIPGPGCSNVNWLALSTGQNHYLTDKYSERQLSFSDSVNY